MRVIRGGEVEVVYGRGYVGRGYPTHSRHPSLRPWSDEGVGSCDWRLVDFFLTFSTMFLLFSSL